MIACAYVCISTRFSAFGVCHGGTSPLVYHMPKSVANVWPVFLFSMNTLYFFARLKVLVLVLVEPDH